MSISRVSTYQLNKSLGTQINNTQSKFNKLSEQIASGTMINHTSENPVAARGIIKANKELENIEMYKSNIEQADVELSQTDETLGSINDQIQKAYDIAMSVANGTMGEEELLAYQQQLNSTIDTMTKLANTKYGDQYIFAGTRTTTMPYQMSANGVLYDGNDGARYAIMGEDHNEQINITGDYLFGQAAFTLDADGNIVMDPANSSGVFGALYGLKAAIQDPANIDEAAIRSSMSELDAGREKVTAGRTKVGAQASSMEDLKTAYTNDALNLEEVRSNLQDTDLPSAISQWYSVYQSLQASYSMMSQTTNVSLLNYI